MSSNFGEKRLGVVIPATVVATASLGAYLYCSGRMRFSSQFPFVSCSLKKSFATVKPRPVPRKGAPRGGLTVDPKSYPWVHRDNRIKEQKFGVEIADPYRWLEDQECPRTAGFIESQNFFAAQVLERCHTREKFSTLFQDMYNFPKFGCPHEEGGKYYFSFNSGLQNQSTIYSSGSDFKNPNVFLNPNEWSTDGTVSLAGIYFSASGKLAAYAESHSGSDWNVMKAIRVLDRPVQGQYYEQLEDELRFVRSSGASWTHDEKGFFYCRYPETNVSANGASGRETASQKYHMLCYHVLGTAQSEDVKLLQFDDNPELFLSGDVTEDGRYVIIGIYPGCHPGNAISYIDLSTVPRDENGVLNFRRGSNDDGDVWAIKPLVESNEDEYSFVANQGSLFTFRTSNNAPRGRVVQVDVENPSRWTDLVPEHEKDALESACAVKNDKMIVCYVRDCSHALELRKFSTGEKINEIGVPEMGSVTSFSGKITSSEAFFAHQSTTMPPTIYRFNAEDNSLTVVHQSEIPGYRPSDYETKQVFVESYDKQAKIPMFITHKKGIDMHGGNPTLLTGYGGFGITMLPTFSVSSVAFVMAYGGVLASANLRGGGEYGLEWRNAGSLGNKQNVYDDFHACSEFLIEKQYCNPSRLAIHGGSNGGLLVAASAIQRPDLYACVVAEVGVFDMMRFHAFTVGHAWVPEYGNPDDIGDFEFLIRYSPLHNVQVPTEGTCQYPSILLTTGDHDDRVSPLHTFKFVAQLQSVLCNASDSKQTNPVIARIDTKAGHGAGKPTNMIVEEVSDIMAFIASVLNVEWVM